MSDTIRNICVHLLYLLAHTLAFAGIVLIFYGSISNWTGQTWAPLEPLVRPTSVYLTLAGLFVTAAAIYVPPKLVAPMELSLYVTAPLAILLVCAAVYFETVQGLPDSVINGIALFTIAGGLVRIFPRPDLLEAHRWRKNAHTVAPTNSPAATGTTEKKPGVGTQ